MKRLLASAALGITLGLTVPALAQHQDPAGHGDPAAAPAEGHGGGHHGPVEGFSAPHAPFNVATVPAPQVTGANGQPTQGPPAFVGPLFNFAILLVIGYMALRRSINPSLAARRAAIETEIAEARRMHTEAESMHREYADKLAQLDDEISRMKGEFVRAGEAERDRIVAEAQAKAERMRDEARASIEQELKALRDELRREAVLAAASAAEETVRRTITAADQTRLADDYVTSLERQAQTEVRA